ncbi:unnamed protein product, partial [Phaeothamnion confervicola]
MSVDGGPEPASGQGAAWELSKENVMPLRRGRKVDKLVRALGPDGGQESSSAAHARRLGEIKSRFESELAAFEDKEDGTDVEGSFAAVPAGSDGGNNGS